MLSINLKFLQVTPRQPVFWVAVISGLAGFILGAAVYPAWHHAVEGGQVVAGVVKYHHASPFYWYETNLWTLSHQLSAVGLWLGSSEKLLSAVISGLLGMISFQALALAALAFSGDFVLALLIPFFIMFTRSHNFGVIYSIELMGTLATYGVLGLSYVVLTLTVLSLKKYRMGYLMLGAAPAIHPSLGSFCFIVVAGVLLLDHFFLGRRFKVAWKFLGMGVLFCLISFLWHLALVRDIPHVSFKEAAPYVSHFARYWCGHRRPVPPEDPGFILHNAAVGMTAVFLFTQRRKLSDHSLFLSSACLISGVLAAPLAAFSWLPPESLPIPLLALMTGRFLNLSIFLFPVFLLSILSSSKDDLRKQVLYLLLVLLLYLLVRHHQTHPEWAVIAMIAVSFVFLILKMSSPFMSRYSEKIHLLGKIFMLIALLKIIFMSFFFLDTWRNEFYGDSDGPFWNVVSSEQGMLLTSHDTGQVQLRSRRPVLLEVGAVDGLPYAVESGPYMNQILKEFYCADLLRAPRTPEEPFADDDHCVPLWQNRTPEEWRKLAEKYGFTQILTSSGWHLKLPVKAENGKYILYDL